MHGLNLFISEKCDFPFTSRPMNVFCDKEKKKPQSYIFSIFDKQVQREKKRCTAKTFSLALLDEQQLSLLFPSAHHFWFNFYTYCLYYVRLSLKLTPCLLSLKSSMFLFALCSRHSHIRSLTNINGVCER